ncbi:alpha-mannosyltransferase [Sphingomonas sp. Leaf412]|uniref:glycosyltransferase family 4 protein n=1 Tax=Sphingomonas sp. Leaf412 TaxID=1736370 RepID=UPI0006F6156E|nr:glycosyltransferase family 1 protein [Sphingomonas sp. Leaf412]KQT34812.1 alpha-mannosyltransferase [Sphingomonas sp. Leaf412]
MKIAIVTDAWTPQVNGVVRTLLATRAALVAMGHRVMVVSPDLFPSVPCPTYPEIRLALAPRGVGQRLAAFAPDAIHLSTEGPLCLAARRWCLAHGLPFTTAYHTQFPDYVAARTRVSPDFVWRYIRWFHRPAAAVLVATPAVEATLRARGIAQVRRWGRGVDRALFHPAGIRDAGLVALPGPVLLYVGRVAVEKNVVAFLSLDVPGTKVVVGDGPARDVLAARYPSALFLGQRRGEDLAACYRAADALVFPSLTDTFGLVMAEAMACGTPVAAYPVTGPVDVLAGGGGVMRADLRDAVAGAMALDRADVARIGARFDWDRATRQFLAALAPLPVPRPIATRAA